MNIILISSNITNSGGTERIGIGLANELAQYPGTTVTIISLFGSDTPFFSVDKRIRIITLFKKEISLFILFPILILKLRKIFKKCSEKSIILNIGTLLCPFTVAANVGLSHRNVAWEHFNVSLIFKSTKERFARFIASTFADAIVTLTAKDKEMYKENFTCKARLYHIPNFLTFDIKRDVNIKKGKIALAVGRLTEQKGFDRLLKIWSKLPSYLGDWELNIIGDGEDGDRLRTLIRDFNLKNVHLIATTATIEHYYQEASLYLMTSRWEGLPMVLIEAQSYGLPIISYDCLTGPRDIVCNASNGYLIEDGQENEFIKRLVQIMEDNTLRNVLSNEAKKDSARFDKVELMDTWIQLFKNV